MTKLKFEGKTFYLYVSQKEVSAGLPSFQGGLGHWLVPDGQAEPKWPIQVELSHLHAKPRPRLTLGGEGWRSG